METLTGVPESIHQNYDSYTNEHGTVYKHKVLFLDGTKAIVATKTQLLAKFKVGEECKYHILETLKDGIVKIKYGEPWTGGGSSQTTVTNTPTTQVYTDLEHPKPQIDVNKSIVLQVCIKAAAEYCAQRNDKQLGTVAGDMYQWYVNMMAPPKIEDSEYEPGTSFTREEDQLPF